MTSANEIQRSSLPIPERKHIGLTTYDAKDPDTSFAPITAMRPPDGAPNVLLIMIDDCGFGAASVFGGPCNTPNMAKLAANGPELQPLPHHRAVLPDARRAAQRSQPPHRRHGWHHRDRHVGARVQLDPAQELRAARRDAAPQRLQHRAVRQVPRGAGVADQPDGPVRPLAAARGLREVLRLHRWRDQPVVPRALRRDHRRSSPRRHRRRATTSPRT